MVLHHGEIGDTNLSNKIHRCVCVVKHEPRHQYIRFNDIQRDRYGNFDLSIVVENHFRLERVKRIALLFISNVDCIGIFIKIVCIVASNVALHYYGNGKWEQPLSPQQLHTSMPTASARYTDDKEMIKIYLKILNALTFSLYFSLLCFFSCLSLFLVKLKFPLICIVEYNK